MNQAVENAIPIVSLAVAVVALGFAAWQGRIAKKQLDLAEATTAKTSDYLDEIRVLVKKSDQTLERVERSIEDRVQRILDFKLEEDRKSSDEASAAMSAIGSGLGGLLKMAVEEAAEDSRVERELRLRGESEPLDPEDNQ
jgi:hypothetical protein